MNLHQASHLARTLLDQHGYKHWAVSYSKKTTNLGHCDYSKKTIYLSAPYTYTGDEGRVRNTILHEIAHIATGPGHGHDEVWRRKAISIGCSGDICTEVRHAKPESRYLMVCTIHGETGQRSKRTGRKYSCSQCRPGVFDSRFLLRMVPNPKYTEQYWAIEAEKPR